MKLLYISPKNSLKLGHGHSWLCSYVTFSSTTRTPEKSRRVVRQHSLTLKSLLMWMECQVICRFPLRDFFISDTREIRQAMVRLSCLPRWNQLYFTCFFSLDHCACLLKCLSFLSDLGYGNQPEKIHSALQDSWNVAFFTGAKVLALTIPECGAKSQNLDTRRDTPNLYILVHQSERM